MPRKPPPPLDAHLAAYRDPQFMDSVSARPLRILAEYLDPLARLRREQVVDTIVIFGSARIHSRETTEKHLQKLLRGGGRRPSAAKRKELERARRAVRMSRYYEEARALAHRLTEWAIDLGSPPHRFVICSGGGPGIMEAANRGAYEAGGKSMGLAIELPHEQRPNRYISPELNFQFHYFFMRKLWFAQLAKALVVFPGGFGTMDELWEMLTLLQVGKSSPHKSILIYGRDYWDKVINWKTMERWGTINEREQSLLQFADTVEDAFQHLRSRLEVHHMSPTPDWLE